jgi:hypothetical protein
VAVALQWHCSGIAVALQWHCSGIATVVLQWLLSCIAVMLQGHETAEGWWHFFGIVSTALERCCRGMALLRDGGVAVVLWRSHCSGIAMAMLQWCLLRSGGVAVGLWRSCCSGFV